MVSIAPAANKSITITKDVAKQPVSKQEKIINTYLSDKIHYRTYRFCLSLLDKRVRTYAVPHIVEKAGKMALVGSIGGGAVGACVAGFPGAMKGAAVGAAILGGGQIIYNLRHFEISRSDDFKKWLGESIKSNVFPMFLEFIQNSSEMSDLMCAIDHDYPDVPVLHTDGHVYEKEQIIRWLNTYIPIAKEIPHIPTEEDPRDVIPNPDWYNKSSPRRIGNIEDPDCTVADLTDKTRHFLDIIRRMKAIRRDVLKKMPPDDIRRQGLEALFKDVVGDLKAHAKACNDKVLGEVESGEMDEEEARTHLRANADAMLLSAMSRRVNR